MNIQTKPFAIIIEDSISTAKMFSLAFEEAGFFTEIILDGNTGKKRLAELTPDVLLLDLHLPFASGSEILHEIQQNPRFHATRIIIATADANYAQLVREDVDFVFLKPISYDQLRQLATRLHNKPNTTSTHAIWQNNRSSLHNHSP